VGVGSFEYARDSAAQLTLHGLYGSVRIDRDEAVLFRHQSELSSNAPLVDDEAFHPVAAQAEIHPRLPVVQRPVCPQSALHQDG
jgi:hypothetical protein